MKTASSTDLAYRKSGSLVSKYLVTSVDLIKKYLFLLKSLKELTLVVTSGKDQNSGNPKW